MKNILIVIAFGIFDIFAGCFFRDLLLIKNEVCQDVHNILLSGKRKIMVNNSAWYDIEKNKNNYEFSTFPPRDSAMFNPIFGLVASTFLCNKGTIRKRPIHNLNSKETEELFSYYISQNNNSFIYTCLSILYSTKYLCHHPHHGLTSCNVDIQVVIRLPEYYTAFDRWSNKKCQVDEQKKNA